MSVVSPVEIQTYFKHSTLAKIWARTGENAVFPVRPSSHGRPRPPAAAAAYGVRCQLGDGKALGDEGRVLVIALLPTCPI